MQPIYWTWTAILVELGIFLSPLTRSNSLAAFLSVLTVHLAASALVAASTYLMLPQRYRQPRVPVFFLMFGFAFIAPVIGALGLLFIVRAALRSDGGGERFAVPVLVALPEYDVQSKETHRSGQGAIRSRLGKEVPAHIRMQSLLTLQVVPNRVSNPILEGLLGDTTDDVRLVAFGMLDAEEKKLSIHIQREQAALADSQKPEQKFACYRRLAELHWELVYASLAQGELRHHILKQAGEFIDSALALNVETNSGILFLKGRILLAQGDPDGAEAAINEALVLGQSKTSALPYLAEMAFMRRDFKRVKTLMGELSQLNLASKTRAIEDFWALREKDINFNDRRYLPHI